MASITEVAEQLRRENLPVLFVDTCIFLDVIRSIKRKFSDCAAHAQALLESATIVPKQCNIVVSNVVVHEWRNNEQELLLEAVRHLKEMQEVSGHFHDACNTLGISVGFGRANYADLGLPKKLHHLSNELLTCAIPIDTDNECNGRALQRVIHNIPPLKWTPFIGPGG